MVKTTLGVDLGGTAIKIGKFDPEGNCLERISVPTPRPATPEAVRDTIIGAIEGLNSDKTCQAIGLGVPGGVDVTGRIARVAINLSGWSDVPIADMLEEKTGLPTTVANDANCAGIGEAWLGAGRNFKNFILLTLGTGVGGAIILDGKLYVGPKGTAGELGLIAINFDGPDCNSGNNGSLEQYASKQGIIRMTGKEPKELAELAEKGDPDTLKFWEEYGNLLGTGIATLVYILTPEAVIIGGGISAGSKFFLPAVKKAVERRVLPSSREDLQILIAELGNRAGMVGAAKLALDLLG